MAGWKSNALSFSAGLGVALLAICIPRFGDLVSIAPNHTVLPFLNQTNLSTNKFICKPQNYTSQIVSIDPLLIYIHNFFRPVEIDALLHAGEPLLEPSTVKRFGRDVENEYRTSWSAIIPPETPALQCVDERVWFFMGSMLARGKDEIEPPQLVRYLAGQKFNKHNDWFEKPQLTWDGRRRAWNRIASFFAILQDNCTGGETYFPHLRPVARIPQDRTDAPINVWREHEDGGLLFPPIKGNALFWVNLNSKGKGDDRVEHAGLPVRDGLKTAMNIWPRQYVGPDAWAEL
jgi:prolyl 4-hydroxylase